jgi:hypothetical protein
MLGFTEVRTTYEKMAKVLLEKPGFSIHSATPGPQPGHPTKMAQIQQK